MAAFSAKSGSLALAGCTAILNGWNKSETTVILPVPQFGASGMNKVVAGIEGWTLSATGFVDGTTHPVKPTAPTTVTFSDGNSTWIGQLLVGDITIGASVEGTATISITGTGDGTFSTVT